MGWAIRVSFSFMDFFTGPYGWLIYSWLFYQWQLFKKNQGGKGTEFAEYFRRNSCARHILGNISLLHVFFMSDSVQENLGSSKKWFSYFKSCILLFFYLAFRICRLDGSWGYFAPLPPYWILHLIGHIEALQLNLKLRDGARNFKAGRLTLSATGL